MSTTGRLAGGSRSTTEQPSDGGARQAQDPAASARAPVAAQGAALPGGPAAPGSPPLAAGGKTSPQRRRERAAVGMTGPETGASSPFAAPVRARPETPAGASGHDSPPAGSTGRTYTIALPAGLELLNANDRGHWTRRRRITAALREAAAWLARQQRIPPLGCVRIVGVLEPPDSRRRDAPNWYPSFKAAVDGLVDAGVLLDDSDRYVTALEMRCGDRCPRGRIVLHVAEVTA